MGRNEKIKISVIIPVYRVENYLHQCVDSVLEQSYQNIEVILVDDGSPDQCPLICDEYAGKDPRVKVIHKANGGLSDARNEGLKQATGNYILFLDSDDYWADASAIEQLVLRADKTHADIINYPYIKFYEQSDEKICMYQAETMPALSDAEAQLGYMLSNSVYIASACNKLIRSEIVKEKPFEVGITSEDIAWCAGLLTRAQSFDYVNLPFYVYRQRARSITHTLQAKNCIDLSANILKCFQLAEKAEENIKDYLYQYIAFQYSTFFAVQARATECPKKCYDLLKPYSWILKYYGSNKKIKILYTGCKLLGFRGLCSLIEHTIKIWDKG